MAVPCGQCIGCKLDRARDWATRIHHEAQLHEENAFLTLTFSDDFYPESGSVRIRDVQDFMRRLRRAVGPVRYFACGEYGADGYRPHYHVLVFGHDFSSTRTLWRMSNSGHPIYRSPLLEKIWPFGFSEIGTLTHQSAGYVARYITKKINGDMAEHHYTREHPYTGEIVRVHPEFIVMSNKPGIGRGWYDKFAKDAFPSDFLIIEGQKVPVPRYYKKQLEEEQSRTITANRKLKAHKHKDNNTPDRLAVREESQYLRASLLKRELEK